MKTTLPPDTSRKGRGRRGVIGLTVVAMVSTLIVLAPAAGASISPTPEPATWGTNGSVFSLLRSGNTLYLGGTFTALVSPDGTQTQGRNGLAAIDLSTGQPLGWNPDVGGLSSTVYAMVLSADAQTVYVGGDFTSIGSEQHSHIAAIDASSG